MNTITSTWLLASTRRFAVVHRNALINRWTVSLLFLLLSLGSIHSAFGFGVAKVPGSPTGLTAAPSNSQVTLNWTAPSGSVTSYNVYRGTTPSGEAATAIQTGLTTPNYTDTGRTNGTTYYYEVAGVNSVGTGSKSSEVSAVPFSRIVAPANLVAAAASSSQINLSWSASTGATSYEVERSPNGSTGWTQIATPTTLSYQDTALAAGTFYFYRLSAMNSSGTSIPSSSVSTITIPVAPIYLAATPNATQISLTWGASQGASSYIIGRSTVSGGPYTTIGTTTGPGYADTNVTDGTTYYYVVSAANASGASSQSSGFSTTFVLLPPPNNLTAQAGNQQVALSWTAVSAATSYTVKRSNISGGPYTDITLSGGLTGTSYTDQSLNNGTTYYYVVTATNSSGESAVSNEVSAIPIGPPASPTGLAAQPGYQQVTLTWTAPAMTTGYNIYRGISSGNETATPINTTPITNPSFTDTGLASGTTYYYTVVAVNSYGTSPQSSEATATLILPPDTPASLTATPGAGQVTLSWTTPPGPVTGYTVQRATTTGGPYTTLATGSTTSYTDTAVVNGTPYFYVVTAYNLNGSGVASDEAMAEPFASPAAPSVTSNYGYSSDGMRAWKNVTGSATYFLYDGSHPVCELDGSGNVLATNTWGGTLLSRHAGGASTFYTFDPSGNAVQRLDGAGNVLGTYAFDAFGLRTGTDATTDPYAGFGGAYGYYADAETGLSLLGHRYYDTGTGRFVTRDPIGYNGGADLYAYCGNNPVMDADPLGTNAFSDFYWNGLGGSTDLVDKYLLGGSMANLGTVMGQHDAGCASGLDVAVAGAQVVGNIAMTVAPGGEEARGTEIAAEAAEHATEDVASDVGTNAISEAISKGHAFKKHILDRGEFKGLDIRTQSQFQEHIEQVMNNGETKSLDRGRTGFWDEATGTLVIHDPSRADLGSAFQPGRGRWYWENKVK